MIFTAQEIQKKVREQHSNLYLTFMDQTKAFDSVDCQTVWKALHKIGGPGKFVKIIQLLNDKMNASVSINDEFTEKLSSELSEDDLQNLWTPSIMPVNTLV